MSKNTLERMGYKRLLDIFIRRILSFYLVYLIKKEYKNNCKVLRKLLLEIIASHIVEEPLEA